MQTEYLTVSTFFGLYLRNNVTSSQNREDLEQELKLPILIKMKKGFKETPSSFEILKMYASVQEAKVLRT